VLRIRPHAARRNVGGVGVPDRQSRHLGRGHGFTPRLLDGWHGWRGVGRGGHGLLRGAGFGLANGHDGLHNGIGIITTLEVVTGKEFAARKMAILECFFQGQWQPA